MPACRWSSVIDFYIRYLEYRRGGFNDLRVSHQPQDLRPPPREMIHLGTRTCTCGCMEPGDPQPELEYIDLGPVIDMKSHQVQAKQYYHCYNSRLRSIV